MSTEDLARLEFDELLRSLRLRAETVAAEFQHAIATVEQRVGELILGAKMGALMEEAARLPEE